MCLLDHFRVRNIDTAVVSPVTRSVDVVLGSLCLSQRISNQLLIKCATSYSVFFHEAALHDSCFKHSPDRRVSKPRELNSRP